MIIQHYIIKGNSGLHSLVVTQDFKLMVIQDYTHNFNSGLLSYRTKLKLL